MHINILGTSIKTEDILYITGLDRGQYNYNAKFTIVFGTGHSLTVELGVGHFNVSKSLDDIEKMKVHVKRIRAEPDAIWQGESQSRTTEQTPKAS